MVRAWCLPSERDVARVRPKILLSFLVICHMILAQDERLLHSARAVRSVSASQ
jgi:hypothetical protein